MTHDFQFQLAAPRDIASRCRDRGHMPRDEERDACKKNDFE